MKSKARHPRGTGSSQDGRTNGSGERSRAPARDPDTRRGGPRTWLYGVHPVLAAVANHRRKVLRLVLTREVEESLGGRIAQVGQAHPLGMPAPEILARDQLERLLPRGAVHQGVCVQVEGLDPVDIDDICRAVEGQSAARLVVLDQVTDPHNVGAIMRSAAAFGAAAVVVQERNAPGSSGVMAKAASGALERVPLVSVVNLSRALDQLKKAGIWCVGLDSDATTALGDADLTGKIALVLGAEGEGLRRLTREHCDLMVRIPLAKGIESLNVSNAAAIALYELARRA